MLSPQDILKKRVSEQALTFVRSGMRLGLGTGSTVYFFLAALGEALQKGHLKNIVGVASSLATEALCRQHFFIPLISLDAIKETLDLYIDGADRIIDQTCVIKGLGGALLREKILSSVARHKLIIADETKYLSPVKNFDLPVEIASFGQEQTIRRVQDYLQIFCQKAVLTTKLYDTSDNGHPIYKFYLTLKNEAQCKELENIAQGLKNLPGVLEHGLFFFAQNDCTFLIAHEDNIPK